MKTKVIAIFASLVMAFMLFGATPANAATKSCTAGQYGYSSTVNWGYNGNVVFQNWSIAGALPMEYRVRWFAPAGNVIYDTGYVGWAGSAPSASPNVQRYFTNSSSILVNAGKYGDNVATCEMWFYPAGV